MIFLKVIDLGGEAISGTEYFHLGRITEFRWSRDIGYHFRRKGALSSLRTIGESWNYYPTGKAVTFVDNHDNQRGHGAGGADILTHTEPRPYKMATAFTLAHPYGFVRIMSSYLWYNTDWRGPPGGGNIRVCHFVKEFFIKAMFSLVISTQTNNRTILGDNWAIRQGL